MNRFDTVSPLDYRYYGDNPLFFKRLQPYVSEAANIQFLIKVEVALVHLLVRMGLCPASAGEDIEKAASEVTPDEVYQEEKRVQHNIRAIVNCLRKHALPSTRPWIHLLATSADIMDTAAALRYKELVRDVMLPDLLSLEAKLIALAREHANQVQMGRTHGQHAEPITFGYAMALYVSRIGSRIQAIDAAQKNLRGKFSGAVGALSTLSLADPDDPSRHERSLLASLGLRPTDTSVSSQIAEPEFVADLAHAVVSCFSVLANLADDVRHLMRTEIAELTDGYGEDEVGSSTMPHKINPKNFENVKSLWKKFMPQMTTVFMDQLSEHQRDLTNSASTRFLPELFTAFCYSVERMKDALDKTSVDKDKMRQHVAASADLVVAEPLYVILALQGCPDAYDIIRTLSRRARETGTKIMDLARSDARVAPILEKIPSRHKKILADPSLYTGDAEGRTIATCNHWEDYCKNLTAEIKQHTVPDEAAVGLVPA